MKLCRFLTKAATYHNDFLKGAASSLFYSFETFLFLNKIFIAIKHASEAYDQGEQYHLAKRLTLAQKE